jgi:hypothetical protein
VKVCASYFKDIWNAKNYYEENLDFENHTGDSNLTRFGEPTKSFDHCGINDIKSEGTEEPGPPESVGLPSEFDPWKDAVEMLNWLEYEFMEGFRFVLIDDVSSKEDNPYSEDTDVRCFSMHHHNEASRGSFKYDRFKDRASASQLTFGATIAAAGLLVISSV